jgi:hypothetical protein
MTFSSKCRTLGLLLALLPATAGAAGDRAFDLDGDGTADLALPAGLDPASYPDDRDGDGTLELGGPGAPATAGAPAAVLPELDFQLVWDSGTTLSNVLGVEAGDADLDGAFDLAGAHFNPNVIYLYEADGQGGYAEVWNSAALAAPPGSYCDFAFADTDGDGLGEIFGAEVSTLGKVMLFEESGGGGFAFVHDTIRESDPVGGRRLRKVLVSDTDLDGRLEVIVVAGGSAPSSSGLVSIWEHSGTVGQNVYTRVYAYTTVSYVFSGALGDSDNDGRPEVVLGLGGFGGFPINIRRIEYDPGQGTWVHTIFTSNVIGLPVGPHVADLDQDGAEELAYGSAGTIEIFESTGENAYAARFTTAEPLNGNVLEITSRTLSVPGTRTIAAGSFGGDLALWGYDSGLDTWDQVYSAPAIGGPIRGLVMADDGEDGFEELVPAVDAANQVRVYRRIPAALGARSGAPPARAGLAAAPNPVAAFTRLTAGPTVARLAIHDASGRLVRRLDAAGGSAVWDARDEAGRAVARGVYWVRAEDDGAALPLLVVR